MFIRVSSSLAVGACLMLAALAQAKEGDPVQGVEVSLEHSPGGPAVWTGKTGTDGIAVTGSLLPGAYIARSGGRIVGYYNVTRAGAIDVLVKEGQVYGKPY